METARRGFQSATAHHQYFSWLKNRENTAWGHFYLFIFLTLPELFGVSFTFRRIIAFCWETGAGHYCQWRVLYMRIDPIYWSDLSTQVKSVNGSIAILMSKTHSLWCFRQARTHLPVKAWTHWQASVLELKSWADIDQRNWSMCCYQKVFFGGKSKHKLSKSQWWGPEQLGWTKKMQSSGSKTMHAWQAGQNAQVKVAWEDSGGKNVLQANFCKTWLTFNIPF